MSKKSKVESSEHFNEIVDLLLAGHTPRFVSDYLLNEYGEKISYVTLNKYKKNNLNVNAEVKKELIKEEKKKLQTKRNQDTVEEVNKEIGKEESLKAAANIKTKYVNKLLNNFNKFDKLELECEDDKTKIEAKKLGLQSLKLVHDILKDDNTIDVNINNGLSEMFDETDIMRFINESQTNEPSSQ